jgi:hypothetical protein
VRLPRICTRHFAFSSPTLFAMLTDKEVEEIRLGVKSGLRGPVLSKWIEALLRDRNERMEREGQRKAERKPTT